MTEFVGTEFSGFPKDFFDFYNELVNNNNREWFTANKSRYTETVLEPMSAFITAMAPRLKRISRHYKADPRPHGGSMFRIYRDVRFSKDKTPYKTHAACHFRHAAGRDAHAPGFYVHLAVDGLHFGGGIWKPPTTHLVKIRDCIADSPAAWSRITGAGAIRKLGGLQGEQLKRAPRGFDPQARHINDIRRKSFFVMQEAESALAGQPELLDTVAQAFRAAAPLNRFITHALELPF